MDRKDHENAERGLLRSAAGPVIENSGTD